MPAVECKEAFAVCAVNVARLLGVFVFGENDYLWFDQPVFKSGSLSQKAFDNGLMVLGQHAGYRVPFGRKLEQ
ncbi:hypothetical protein D3C86_2119870 [compost metagenome]